jgi:chemotaxis protein CheD
LEYLREEGIPVSSRDVGGTQGRKILFFTEDAKILLKRLSYIEDLPMKREEDKYLSTLQKTEKTGKIVLF